MTFSLHGVGVSRGIAIGKAHIVVHADLDVREYPVAPDAVDAEIARLREAVTQARENLHAIREKIPASTPADIAAFIDTHLLMLEDSTLTEEPVHIIRERRCNAEWALKIQRDVLVGVFELMDDPYLRTRQDDVDHVVNRIQRILLNHAPLHHEVAGSQLSGKVLIADDLTPADALLMQHNAIAAFVTEFGGQTSHTSILARSLGIPGVVGVHHARRYIREDEILIVDGKGGVVIGEPDEQTLRHYKQRRREQQKYYQGLKRLKAAPAVTSDGQAIDLYANVELPADFEAARRVGATGVGLYRTEFLYMNRSVAPSEEEHFESYRQLVEALGGLPVTIRTLDIGADKHADGILASRTAGANPALGLRAVRLGLKEPSLSWPQLRAIVRVSALGPVRMMLPMLSTIDEARQVVDIVRTMQADFVQNDVPFDPHMQIGGMIEVPAAAMFADGFARYLDFLSIGTNDLIQYAIAIDRINDEVNYLYDPLHPGVLRLIATTIDAGRRRGTPVAMCGEMAGDTRYTRLLLALGLRIFSVHPSALLEVKDVITNTAVGDIEPLARRVLRTSSMDRFRALIEAIG
ncbi:MAG: phosphoenolpyruvate--protein phosphotransferase [Gammaproteobacteria bacterium]|nr:phosphoenolpyruvate--protein phosphotransferase [Gammaproteobacteria bacterium]MBI5617166.1 phosphoenolpyruvate--protein phosphotransferase [Gammaproteobacteria bacterium]